MLWIYYYSDQWKYEYIIIVINENNESTNSIDLYRHTSSYYNTFIVLWGLGFGHEEKYDENQILWKEWDKIEISCVAGGIAKSCNTK